MFMMLQSEEEKWSILYRGAENGLGIHAFDGRVSSRAGQRSARKENATVDGVGVKTILSGGNQRGKQFTQWARVVSGFSLSRIALLRLSICREALRREKERNREVHRIAKPASSV
jgi:hypothetical protein